MSASTRLLLCGLLALTACAASASAAIRSRDQVGDIISRPAPPPTENALAAIQRSREQVKQRLASIAAQADPLAGALAAYKKDPNVKTAIELLHREAVVANVGAGESEKIAAEADAIAKTCAKLAAQCAQQAALLGGTSAAANRAQADYETARSAGLGELRDMHQALLAKGVTNELQLSAPERRKISRLLRLYGAADLAERFLRMESSANQAALAKLNELSERFASRQQDFADLGAAYRLHAASFQTVGGSVGRVARIIELNQRFDAESQAAAEVETELGKMDEVLGRTFDSLPDDLTPIFASGGGEQKPAAPTGLWGRLLRLLNLGGKAKPHPTEGEKEN